MSGDMVRRAVLVLIFLSAYGTPGWAQGVDPFLTGENWISALDSTRVQRIGNWWEGSFRRAKTGFLGSRVDKAALTFAFEGSGLAVRLGGNAVPVYGSPDLGRLAVVIDDGDTLIVYPRAATREVVLARDLEPGKHSVRLEHQFDSDSEFCRIAGFLILGDSSGDLGLSINGEENAFLVDVRAVLTREGREIRNTLVRNWLTGGCRLTGVPAGDGYTLSLTASGWETQTIEGISISPGVETTLPPVYLSRRVSALTFVHFPALGHPVIRKPGESFRTRFAANQNKIDKASLSRRVGPAVISRDLSFEEDTTAAYYYNREIVAEIPDDVPEGLYQLSVEYSGTRGDRSWSRSLHSPSSVHIVKSFPDDPVFLTFGHLDTWGQEVAERIAELADIANLLAPDMVLVSNEVNPAYVSGALAHLQMPYVINFGNHQFFGHEKWYGDPVDIVDFGPDLCILNFGHPWHADLTKADALLSSRAGVRCKVINAFEPNAPLESFLDKYEIPMIADGHGPEYKVMVMGKTPTQRVGKAHWARLVRFKDNRVESCTYQESQWGYPYNEGEFPLQIAYAPANNGSHSEVTATVTNTLEEAFPKAKLTFVLPSGRYVTSEGDLESAVDSDDGKYTVLTVRVDLPAEDVLSVAVRPEPPADSLSSD